MSSHLILHLRLEPSANSKLNINLRRNQSSMNQNQTKSRFTNPVNSDSDRAQWDSLVTECTISKRKLERRNMRTRNQSDANLTPRETKISVDLSASRANNLGLIVASHFQRLRCTTRRWHCRLAV